MKLLQLRTIAGFIIAFTLIFALPAHANEENQMTKFTFSQSIQVPGRILPAGTYRFVLATNDSNRNIVEIFNADGTELYATIQTISAERGRKAYGTSVTFAQCSNAQPKALVTWFYPGNDIGHEFVYSKQVDSELAQAANN